MCGGDFGLGSGSKFNCAARVGSGRVRSARVGSGRVRSARVGSGQTILAMGRVRASVLSPCRPLSFVYCFCLLCIPLSDLLCYFVATLLMVCVYRALCLY